jgi:hypothetical protein
MARGLCRRVVGRARAGVKAQGGLPALGMARRDSERGAGGFPERRGRRERGTGGGRARLAPRGAPRRVDTRCRIFALGRRHLRIAAARPDSTVQTRCAAKSQCAVQLRCQPAVQSRCQPVPVSDASHSVSLRVSRADSERTLSLMHKSVHMGHEQSAHVCLSGKVNIVLYQPSRAGTAKVRGGNR